MKAVKAKCKIFIRKQLIQFQLFIFYMYKPACVQKTFYGQVLFIWVFFFGGALWADSVSLRMNTIMPHDQFKITRIGKNLVVNCYEYPKKYRVCT